MKSIYFSCLVFLLSCNANENALIKLEGKTMGTTYHISYLPNTQGQETKDESNMKAGIDSLLVKFNQSVSTYIPTSTISRVNERDTLIEVDDYFVQVFKSAREVSEKTDGAFDVTVMPLVNGWGFGYTDTISMIKATVDSLKNLVDYRKVSLSEKDRKWMITKMDKRIQVDFSAIAKGYGVDLVALLLEQKGITNYMVEIGGEVVARGKNSKGDAWRIGVEKPVEDASGIHSEFKEILKLENKALATSGNYRNFYVRNGKKISHEIDPKTGYPAQNNLLSATVVANDCMTADAYATAFMVMGLKKTLLFLKTNPSLDAYLIYADEKGEMKTTYTPGVKNMIVKPD